LPLLLARLFYFFYFGAVGCYVPFINLYLEGVGLSGSAIGLLAALPPLMLLGASPLWGALGDRFHIHRRLLPIATLGAILPTLLMLATAQLPVLIVLVVVAAFFISPTLALIDSAVLDLVDGTRYSYGNIRIWGSVGFTLFTWLMGFVINARGLPWLFYGNAALLLVSGLIALAMPPRRQTWQTSFRASVGQLLRRRPLALFLVGTFLVGASLQASYSFYPLHLIALGANPAWLGLAGALGALAEVPVLYASGRIFERLGLRRTVMGGYLMFAVRWGILALTTSPRVALFTNLLHGVTFSPFLAGGIAFVAGQTPPGLHGTAQGLLTAVGFGLGAAVGAFGGGLLYDAFGASGMFAVGALAALLATFFVGLASEAARPAPTGEATPPIS
jgi:PPP family 3-phenylpropionic acid transporter